jgi:hypothetical protein
VAEVSETESTLDVTAAASGLDEKAPIADVNWEPFSSSWARLLVGVAGLKNVFQLVVICETALDVPPVPAEGATAGADEADGRTDDAAAVKDPCAFCGFCVELEPLDEQAAIAVTNTRPSAGARYTRRAVELNRIITRPLGRRLVSSD